MEVGKYWKRFDGCKGYKEKCSLHDGVLEADNTLRKLFSQQRDSWEVPELDDPYETLISVYDQYDSFKCKEELPEEAAAPKVFELGDQRKPAGTSSIVDESSFNRNFSELFTEGSLKYMNWEGVFAAGGSVMACLQPLPPKHDISNIARRRFMHDERFPGSDVDLFLYGMDAEQAKKKIVEIYDAVREAVPFEVLCFRSAHSITLVSEYPFRHIQIILRLYSSPLEVLTGFDVDSCAIGFDGSKVWVAQRCHLALVNQRNPINLTRRSPTYEMRLAKYAQRGFEVPVPELQKDRVNPTIFERPWNKVTGLAKLILLERLRTPEARFRYREQHRAMKMRNLYSSAFAMRFGMRGMLRNPWMAPRMEKINPTKQGAEASDYSTVFLPWGKGYNAKRCRSLMLAKDKILNDPYVSKGRKYKLHPCFVGTAEEVIEDCAPKDPPIPDDVDKKELEGYVRGPLTFIEDDPGRQMIGSFHPVEDEDWSNGAYFTAEMNELFVAANSDNSESMMKLLESGLSPNSTDFTGRTALHITAFSGSTKCAQILLEHGARMITRMTDGRTVLHICAAYGHKELIAIFLEKSKQNVKDVEAAQSATVEGVENKSPEESTPADVLNIDVEEWNHSLSPLQVAIMFGQADAAEELLKHGANANKTWALGEPEDYDYEVASCLSIVMRVSQWDLAKSKKLLQILLKYGCDVTRLDQSLRNILHIAASRGCHAFITQVIEAAPVMKEKGLNVISLDLQTPLIAAIDKGHEECVKTLLSLGAKLESTDDDCQLARRRSSAIHGGDWSTQSKKRQLSELTPQEMPNLLQRVVTKLNIGAECEDFDVLEDEEAAAEVGGRDHPTKIRKNDPYAIIKMLIDHGTDVNHLMDNGSKQTLVDYVDKRIEELKTHHDEKGEENCIKKYRQKESSCPKPTTVVDGILVSCQTGLPASYKSHSKIRSLLLKVKPDSYLFPMLQARAFEQDVIPLVPNLYASHGRTVEDQISAYKELRKILTDAGGVEYHKLMGKRRKDKRAKKDSEDEDPEDEENKRAKLTIEKVISRYYLLKQKTAHLSYIEDERLGMLLETRLQSSYHKLFEAVWQGEIEYVEHVTMTDNIAVGLSGALEDRLLVCVQNRYGQTPLTLAVLRGHVKLAAKLVEIAAKQYVPEEKIKDTVDLKDPLKAGRLNNYAVEALVNELGSDADVDDDDDNKDSAEEMDEDIDFADEPMDENSEEVESEGEIMEASPNSSEEEFHEENTGVDNLLSEVATMRNDARKAAQSAAAHQVGLSADIGTEKVRLCHIPPEVLLSHPGIFPAELVERELREEWRTDIKRLLRFLWKSHLNPTDEESKTVKKELLENPVNVETYGYYYCEVKAFRSATPLELAILMKSPDALNVLLDACELWDSEWIDEATERGKLIRDAPDGSPGDVAMKKEEVPGDMVDKKAAKSGEGKDHTNLSCRLVRPEDSGKQLQDLAVLVDDPSLLSCLITRTGASFSFGELLNDLKVAFMEEKKKLKKLALQSDKLPAPEDDFMDVSRTLRTTTVLHSAVSYGAKKTSEWLLKSCGVEAFKQFLNAKSKSSEARTAERLGKFFLQNQFAGISDQGSPEAALSTYYCGNAHMEDDKKRNIFHTAIATGAIDMLKFLLESFAAMGQMDAALAVLNKPRVVEPYKYEPPSILNPSSAAFISGTTPLQAAALVGHLDHFNLLLDIGVDIRVPDGVGSRGWNLLAFCVAGKGLSSSLTTHISTEPPPRKTASAVEMVKCLIEHPKVGIEVAREMLTERMGDSKMTPLMLAASLENVDTVEVLKEILGEGVYSCQSSEGRTALHIGSKTGKPDLVHSLLTTRQISSSQEGVSIPTTIKAEIVDAAAQEDHVGLTPMDIAMEVACSNGRKKLKTNEYAAVEKTASDNEELRAYADVREASTSRKRIRAMFEDVKASAVQATEDAQKTEEHSVDHTANTEDLSIDVNKAVSQIIARETGLGE